MNGIALYLSLCLLSSIIGCIFSFTTWGVIVGLVGMAIMYIEWAYYFVLNKQEIQDIITSLIVCVLVQIGIIVDQCITGINRYSMLFFTNTISDLTMTIYLCYWTKHGS